MSIRSYIHIGSAKCASTSLQEHYFDKHPELFHLGCSAGGLVPPYYNPAVKLALEWDLRLACDFVYDHERVSETFADCGKDFADSGRKYMGISSESFTMSMHHECDITQTADRLCRLFGKESKILFITRSQDDHLKSIYKEWIWGGMPLTWREFLNAIFYGQFQSLYSELFFDRIAEYYANLFGRENLLVLPVELLFQNQADFLTRISNFLEIEDCIHELPNANKARPESMVEHMRQMNEVNRHNIGRSVMEPANTFRHDEYYTEILGMPAPPDNDADIRRKRQNVRLTQLGDSDGSNHAMKLDWTADPVVVAHMEEKYREGNGRLAEYLDLDLGQWGYEKLSITNRSEDDSGWRKWLPKSGA